jgi:CHAD domain-containing protein
LTQLLANSGADLAIRDQRPDEKVHQARVQSKRLAAALHLYKGFIPKMEYRKARKPIKKAARLLARRRDLDVVRKTVWSRTRRLSAKDQQAVKQWLQDRMPGSGMTAPGQMQQACAQLSTALRKWPQPQGIEASELFVKGSKAAFQKARKAYRKARQTCSIEEFHQWRIWTKRLFLQNQIASSLHLAAGAETLKALDKLQNKLGDLHDVALARKFVMAEKDGPKKPLKRLKEILKKDRDELRRKVLKRGEKIFGDKAGRSMKGQWSDQYCP